MAFFSRLRRRFGREEAQTMSEYAVVIAVITPAIVLAYGLLSGRIAQLIDSVRGILGG